MTIWRLYIICKNKVKVAVTSIFSKSSHFCIGRFFRLWAVLKYIINCSWLVILPHHGKPEKTPSLQLYFGLPIQCFSSPAHSFQNLMTIILLHSMKFTNDWKEILYLIKKQQLSNIPRVVYQWAFLIYSAGNRTVYFCVYCTVYATTQHWSSPWSYQ